MRPLLVGEAPSRSAGSVRAFDGRCGARLAVLVGTDVAGLARRFDLLNLLDAYPGREGKGSRFPAPEARAAARAVLAVAPHPVLVLAGRRVAGAFGLSPTVPYLAWSAVGGRLVGVLPHPSAVNRWWNAPGSERLAAEFLARSLHVDPRAA